MPFGVVIDAVDSYLRTLDERDVERLSTDRLGALAAVFPALAGLGTAVDVPVNAGERFRVYRRRRRARSSGSPHGNRWSWSSTTCSGPTRLRSSSPPTSPGDRRPEP